MSYFYVISPARSDPLFVQKKIILNEAGPVFGTRPFFPLDEHQFFRLETMVVDIQNSQFVLADLSYGRPSCYYELGVAEAIRAEVHLIAENGTHIHQVSDLSHVKYYCGLDEYRTCISNLFT